MNEKDSHGGEVICITARFELSNKNHIGTFNKTLYAAESLKQNHPGLG